MKFEESLAPKKEDIKNLRDILVKYNQQHFETKEQKEFLLPIKNDDNQLIAGISGEIFGNWMEVDYLAVEENYRSHGYGKQLLPKIRLSRSFSLRKLSINWNRTFFYKRTIKG